MVCHLRDVPLTHANSHQARVDPTVPIEETIGYIAEYVKAGKLGGISLSEVSAKSIRKAHAVHPISAVEVEFSLWATEILENDVASTCAELGIPIIAYSPLGRGFLVSLYIYLTELTLILKLDRQIQEAQRPGAKFLPDTSATLPA